MSTSQRKASSLPRCVSARATAGPPRTTPQRAGIRAASRCAMLRPAAGIGQDRPRWPQAEGQEPRPADGTADRSLGTRIGAALGIVLDWLGDVAGRLGYRMFVMNDDEACWRGWQIIRLHGGLGRRYRDRRFDTLAGRSPGSRHRPGEPAWPAGPGHRGPFGQ
jgi:hypothetical protein